MGKTGRTQTPAQKAASERNLRKGHEALAARLAGKPAEPAPEPAKPAKPRVVRAKAQPARRRQVKPRKVPPRAAAPEPADPKRRSGGGFLSGFMEGLGG